MRQIIVEKYGISFRKGERFKVIFGLLRNAIFFLKWRLYKLIHAIHDPIVHYYAVCWNEEKILPFMFQHYDTMVSQYFIYDNSSTDLSLQIIERNPKAKVIPFKTNGFNDEIQIDIKNQCWKQSRGKADYVIVCDVDELLYVPEYEKFLAELEKSNISLPLSKGFDMCSDRFPEFSATLLLINKVNKGVYNRDYSKCVLFSPYKIVDINYEPGAHFCHPYGLVRISEQPIYNLLHYKNIGIDYVIDRYRQYRKRMSKENIEKGYAQQYFEEESAIKENFKSMMDNSQVVVE